MLSDVLGPSFATTILYFKMTKLHVTQLKKHANIKKPRHYGMASSKVMTSILLKTCKKLFVKQSRTFL